MESIDHLLQKYDQQVAPFEQAKLEKRRRQERAVELINELVLPMLYRVQKRLEEHGHIAAVAQIPVESRSCCLYLQPKEHNVNGSLHFGLANKETFYSQMYLWRNGVCQPCPGARLDVSEVNQRVIEEKIYQFLAAVLQVS